jgi:hypothetical protein
MPDCHCADRENIDKKALGKEEESMCDITDVGLSEPAAARVFFKRTEHGA